ncbi:hypothetical protein [Methylobacterium trifolii]|uniref:hypothetical protein n=1 Tax=Methylobacterium trifolii TaxID=1003092 RepID=UPI001EDCDA84|nr:hypothetical protein [Methylobacterium trifolii]
MSLFILFFSRSSSPQGRAANSTNPGSGRDFSADFNAAMNILKSRIDQSFPDNYQASFRSNRDANRDYGDTRAEVLDTASAAVAAALREGATVRQAAEAGAASIGI